MEEGTALVLALQLLALAAIAAALLLYLLCRLRPPPRFAAAAAASSPFNKRSLLAAHPCNAVLVTHADSALGLQVALWLARRGFRVFAGLKEPEGDAPAAAACRAWTKAREDAALLQEERQDSYYCCSGGGGGGGGGWLHPLRLDASKEDELHEAASAVRGRLPAAEDGLWAVVHVGGGGACASRGRLESQQSAHWERLLRENVVGALRAARALLPLLRSQKGRLLLLGASSEPSGGGGGGGGLVAWSAARAAVEGAANALRAEVAPVHVITLRPHHTFTPEALFVPPKWRAAAESSSRAADVEAGEERDAAATRRILQEPVECRVIGDDTLLAIEDALLCARPKHSYPLRPHANPRPHALRSPFFALIARLFAKSSSDAAAAAATRG